MPRLAQTAGLTDVQQEILKTVRQFVDKEIIPHAQALEHADEYPADIVAGMREMGLFGLTIPEEYGGLGESLLTYALVVEQIARGWMSVSGIINTHFIVAHMIKQHGTPEQKQKFLPPMAVGEVRGSFSMSEPDLGSDVAAITTKAARDEAGAYKVNGAKMWLTNGGSSTLIALLARTDEGAAKPHQNLTAFLVEKPAGFGEVLPGLTIPGKIDKMGYKGVDTTEALFDNFELPADSVLGGRPGRGFAQMMDGIEVGRVNVSARACGMTIRAFELAVAYAQQRKTFGKPIADHQAIAFKLAEMATKVEAAHLMMVNAARLKDSGERNDVAAGMAKPVKQFVDKEIIPHAQALEHADEYPADIVAGMREMGLFGLTIPEEYGGLGESLLTYALVVEQIARGWMSVSGIINTHFIVAHMIKQHGTPEQKQKFLPPMAVGEVRGSFSMSEPDLGSDVAAITTRAARDEAGGYKVNGAKMWLTNGGSSTLIALLARTDEGAAKPHQNLTAFLVEKPTGFGEVLPGLTIPGKIDKMGYKGVDTTEALFDDFSLPADSVLGGQPGRGFAQMMDGIEVGRVNVSARACGMTIRAFELAVAYAQQRKTFGKPIADHQAIAFKLAEMATKVEAAHLMMVNAARLKDSGERNDVAAGMAKLLASEYCAEVTQDAFRIHGGYGYSTEYEIERLMREAPFLLIGEGTSEIQKMIISRGLLREYKILRSIVPNGPGRLSGGPFPCAVRQPAKATAQPDPANSTLDPAGSTPDPVRSTPDPARSTKIRCRSLAATGGEPTRVRWMTSWTPVSSSASGRQVITPCCSSGSPSTL